MAQTQLADVIVPAEFTAYQVENSLVSTALFTSGVRSKLRPLCEFIQARDPLPRQCQTFVG
jgi:hypothetical protein